MSVFPVSYSADPLPDSAALNGGSYHLRTVANALAGHASAVRGVSQQIGPGLWADDASGRAKALLSALADELAAGSDSIHRAADELATLAQYVTSKRGAYDQLGMQIGALEHAPPGTALAHGLLEVASLAEQRRAIEGDVSAAMAHAAGVISQCASNAPRRNHGSVWSRLWGALDGTAHGLEHGAAGLAHLVADLASGAWDGTTQLVHLVAAIVVESARLSPERMVLDPRGYEHDLAQFVQGTESVASAAVHHPLNFLETLVNYQDFRRDPVHWLGTLVPTIAIGLATDGAGLAAKGAGSAESVTALADSASAGAALKAMTPAARGSFFADVIRQWDAQAPKLASVKIGDQIYQFTPSDKLGFSQHLLDHTLVGKLGKDGFYQGGHLPNVSDVQTGKTAFPSDWSVNKIVGSVYQVVNDPKSTWTFDMNMPDTRLNVTGMVDGIPIKVVIQPGGDGIVTAYPEDPNYTPIKITGL